MFLKRLKHRIGCGTFVIFQYPPQRFSGVFQGGGGRGAGEQARAMNILEDWGREMRARGDLWEALSFSPSLSCTSCTSPTQTAMLQ